MSAVRTALSDSPSPFRISDPVQQRVHDRLERLVGLGPVAHFRDACQVMSAPGAFSATTTVVGHLLRELEDALRDVLVPIAPPPTDPRESRRSLLDRVLLEAGVATDSALAQALLPLTAVRNPRASRPTHASQIRAILGALDISPTSEVGAGWLRIARKEYGLIRFAHRKNLDAPRPVDAEFVTLWHSMVLVFDFVLSRFETRFHTVLLDVAALRTLATPTEEDARRLVSGLPNAPVVRHHFFEGNQNAAWLPLLEKAGLFREPPPPVVDQDRGSTTFIAWPESRYLARIAANPNTQRILARVLDEMAGTDNVRVIGDVIEALSLLPTSLGVTARDRVLAWLEHQDRLFMIGHRELLPLARHMFESGEVAASRRILHILLDLRPRVGQPPSAGTPRTDQWDYRRLIAEALPSESLFPDPFERFCFLLERLEECGDLESSTGGLTSQYRRQAIEDSSQDDDDDPFGALLSGVRDAAAEVAVREPSRLPLVLERLQRGSDARVWKTRLELNLLRTSEPPAREQIRDRLFDRALLAETDYFHEYRTLFRDRFSILTPEEQERLLATLVEAPSVDRLLAARLSDGAEMPTDAEVIELRERIARDLLSLVAATLPPKYAALYDTLCERYGPAGHPEFLFYSRSSFGAWGSRSPISPEALSEFSVPDLRAYLTSWVPPGNPFDEPTREGLASTLTSVVGNEPERYAASILELRLPEPTYVRGVIAGYFAATKTRRPFPWEPVLAYCLWAVQQSSPSVPPSPAPLGRDPGWSWVHGTVLDLLRDGLDASERLIPFPFRGAVFSILAVLARDASSPSPEHDSQVADFASSGINSTRGRALELVLEYGVWVREMTGPDAPASFELMPEVRDLVQERLDPHLEPSPSVRAIYGMQLGRLAYLDSAWLAAWRDRIFPSGPEQARLRRAAWSAFIRYGHVNVFLYRLLTTVFEEEVAHLLAEPKADDDAKRLAEHLAWLYVWGAVPLSPDGPWAGFLAGAPTDLVRIAIGSVGRGLLHAEEPIPDEARRRLDTLWVARITALSERPDLGADELGEYVWWFASKQFDSAWAADRLLEVAVLRGGLPANHGLLEVLPALAPGIPDRAALIIREVARGETDPGLLSYESSAFRSVILAVRAASGDSAESIIRDTLGLLASRGCTELLDLGSKPPGATGDSRAEPA